MTISTRRINIQRAEVRANGPVSIKAFTLLEAMLAVTLGGLVLAGVLSTFLMMGRTSFDSVNYSQIESETRRALETFGQDARLARDIRWVSNQSMTLTLVEAGSGTKLVTYAYDTLTGSPTYRCFYRVEEPKLPSDRREKVVLARSVADIAFRRYKLEQAGTGANDAVNDLETKQVQLTLHCVRRGATTAAATQTALSACYILRNKRVSN